MFSLLIVSGHLLTAFLLVGLCLILYSTGVDMAEDSVTSHMHDFTTFYYSVMLKTFGKGRLG